MRAAVRIALAIVFLAAVALAAYLLIWHSKERETWATLTGVLAVIAAEIAALPALKVLEVQEDALLPRPIPYFDLSSRYSLLQLRVKNFGASVAYDVVLTWKTRPMDHKNEEVVSLDRISALLPNESVSVLIGTSSDMVRKYSTDRYEGTVHFQDGAGRRLTQNFVCSLDADQKRLVHDEELPKTLRDLQEIPKEIARIADALKRSD